MPNRVCPRHQGEHPCSCGMGNLYRFVEPVLLYLLREQGPCHGYDLHQQVARHALTDAKIERAVLYRTLRSLESHGHVESVWNTKDAGPPRRVYSITASGNIHLQEWVVVLEQLSRSMSGFVRKTRRGVNKRAIAAPVSPTLSLGASVKGGASSSGRKPPRLPKSGT